MSRLFERSNVRLIIRSSEHLQCAIGVLGLHHNACPNGISLPCLPSVCREGVKVIPGGSKKLKRMITD